MRADKGTVSARSYRSCRVCRVCRVMQGTTRRRSNSKGPTISSVGTQQEDRIVTDVKEMQGTEGGEKFA